VPRAGRRLGLVTLVAMAGVARTAEPAAHVPLVTPLPKPVFIGTPRFIVSPNLEPVTGRLREPFLVPPGTVNLARGRPVTGSVAKPFLGAYALVTDGNKEATGNSFVELEPGRQWVQIDLGAAGAIHAILVWHYHSEARVYHDVVVQVSTDPDFVRDVRTVFNNDADNSAGLGVGTDKEYVDTFEGRLVPVAGVTARYVRLHSQGNTSDDMNNYIEVEVFGAPSPAARAPPP
jgi:hypothetical protein